MNTIIVGLQHGDEAKGKLCDYLMKDYDICVRYSGGPNTGATVWVSEKKYKFHHLPVGILRNKKSYITSSCLIHPESFLRELDFYRKEGFNVDNLVRISPDCHVITQEHIREDEKNESGSKAVGSTKRGISPCATAKYARKGIRIESLKEFNKFFADTSRVLNKAIKNNKNILFEGTQGALLDIDHGTTYPYISTTNNVAGAACVSAGIGPTNIDKVIGVFKPYMTKVGAGPFPSKITDPEIVDFLVERGDEYGTTTNRKRMVGWFDVPLFTHACRVNGVTDFALMKADVMEDIPYYKIRLGSTSYHPFREIPARKTDLQKDTHVSSYLQCDNFNTHDFIRMLTNFVKHDTNARVQYISTGRDRDSITDLTLSQTKE